MSLVTIFSALEARVRVVDASIRAFSSSIPDTWPIPRESVSLLLEGPLGRHRHACWKSPPVAVSPHTQIQTVSLVQSETMSLVQSETMTLIQPETVSLVQPVSDSA